MEKETKVQLERLKELEQMLWERIQTLQKNGKHSGRLYKLYSDVSFKILRHEAIYQKDRDENDPCVLDEFVDE